MRFVLTAAVVLSAQIAIAFERELAEAQRCFLRKAAEYAIAFCYAPTELVGAVRGACDDEYRATIAAFADSPRASVLTDRDKLELAKQLFDRADSQIQYFITEERLIQQACLSR